jgi:hypothetical protein
MDLALIHATVATNLYAKNHRVVTASFKVCGQSRRKSGVSNPGSITQFFAEMEGLDAVNSWGRGEVCNSVQSDEPTRSNMTDGLEQIARSRQPDCL